MKHPNRKYLAEANMAMNSRNTGYDRQIPK
jgi:hypothetical protein